ncbi:uncharacterized protein LOC123516704 [Portunus trituberculatus]|uniref:uncharacterized protein LOC123516704 n=1 Tax=Portunus trituberculatus TaxID=210409 RepID=UPI001E1D0B50|nr:uncharacterized protein LOC123516704 [Portunus trituberculatus]
MKTLTKKLSSCVLSEDQLLLLVENHTIKKQKKCDLPWVEVVKRLLTRAADEDNGVLFQNTSTIIRVHLNEVVRNGLKNPSKLGQKYSDILNSLLTHLHLTLEDKNLQVVEMYTLLSLILAAVIDLSIASYKKGNEASLVAKIFMKLTMIFGHSEELLLDAILHCRTLIHPRSRQPLVQVPLIKRLFSSIRLGQTMDPVLYLKYLLLGKLWLFMTEKRNFYEARYSVASLPVFLALPTANSAQDPYLSLYGLGKTRMYIAKVLKLPDNVPDWAAEEKVPWLGLSKWSTRLVLKSMTLLGALQTFYGDWYKEIKVCGDYQVKRERKPKVGSSKSNNNKAMAGKVKTKDCKEFHRPPFSEKSSDEDVKLELEIVNVVSDITDEESQPCNSRINESNRKQKKKRKFKEVLPSKEKKRKLQDYEEEENELPAVNKSVSLTKTKSGLSKSSKNKNICRQKETGNTCYKLTEDSPEVPISPINSEESMKKDNEIVDRNNHVADGESPFGNKSVKKKGTKRKSVEAVEQKSKKGKLENYKEDKEIDAALTNKAEKKKMKKKSKKTTKTMTGSSNKNSEEHAHHGKADESDVLPDTEHTLEDINFSPPVEEKLKTLEKATKKRSRKIPIFTSMDKEDMRDETKKNSCLFDEVCEFSGDASSLVASNRTQGRKSSRRQKLFKKQKRIIKSMTFTVTELEEKRDRLVVQEFENNNNNSIGKLSENEDPEIKAANIITAEEQVIGSEKKANFDSHEEITCNDTSATEFLRVHSVNADPCGNSSEDSSDYDRSNGDEDNDLEHSKVRLELKNSTECKKEEENLINGSNAKNQAIHKDDNEYTDESKSISDCTDETDKGTLLEVRSKVTETPENDIRKIQQNDSFVTESDADVSSEEIQLEGENSEDNVIVDVVNGNENSDGELVLESGPDDMKNDCDNILSTNDGSDTFRKDNEIPSNASKLLDKESYGNTEEYEKLNDEENDLEDEIIITKCIILSQESKNMKIDNNSGKETVTPTTTEKDEDGKDTQLIEDVKEIEYCGHHDGHKEDSKISNKFHDITVLESECETKIIMESISKTNDISQCNVRDDESAILKSPESDQAITSRKESSELSTIEDTKNFIELKKEEEVIEVEDLLEEVKQEGEIKTSPIKISSIKMSPIKTSPIKTSPTAVEDTSIMAKASSIKISPTVIKDASTIPPIQHCRSTEQSKDVVQDPVSRMMNNLYKSNTVKTENNEKEQSSSEIQNSSLFNGNENAVSDDDDNKSVIVDENEEIECMLQNIVKDTGRPSSIHGLRERLLSESSVKDEQKENLDHDQDDKEPLQNNEMSPCASQIKISDSSSHPLLETTEDMSSKSVTPTENQEDTDSLIDTIVKDESRLAEIRELRETLFCKASVLDESMDISEHDKHGKEPARNHCNIQIEKDEDSSQNFHLDDKPLPNFDSSSSDTVKKSKDLKDISCTFHVDKHLTTGNDSSIPNENEVQNTEDNRSKVSRDKDQETSDNKHCQKAEYDIVQNDEFMHITSKTIERENYSVSTVGMNTTEEASSKPLDSESGEANEPEELSDINTSTDGSHSLVLKLSNAEETESVIDESRDKCIEGADEAYEASSDASEDPAPRTRRRSRSLRKSFAQEELQMASDSDSSPVQTFCQKGSAVDAAGHQRSKRIRSQSCSLESVPSALQTLNKSQTLEKSINKIFAIEKEYTFDETFTMTDKDTSYLEASMPKNINISYNEKKAPMVSSENKQNVLPVESDEAPIVKSQKNTTKPSMEIVTETTETDAVESSSNASSPSLKNKEQLHELILPKKDIFLSSDSTLTESPNKPSSPCKPNSDDTSQIELSGHSKGELPSKVIEDTTADSDTLPNKGETTSIKLDVPSNETCKSQEHEILTRVHNSISEEENLKSLDVMKDLENQEALSEIPRIEERDASDKTESIEDIKSETEHEIRKSAEGIQVTESKIQQEEIVKEIGSFKNLGNGIDDEEIRQEVDQSQKHIDDELNLEMGEGIYEGEEIEVLSTSGTDEEDEKETVGTTSETFDSTDVEARKAGLLISKKSLRSHIRQLHMTNDEKDAGSDSESKDSRLAQIPVGKAQCLSQVALTKEVLISPDVSDEECELVSIGVDLSDSKVPVEEVTLDDNTSQKDVSLCFSNLNMQKSNGGINSPHKTIPEEQDETAIPKGSSEHCSKAPTFQRSETLTIPSSLCIPDTEKPDNRKKSSRRSSRGAAADCASYSIQTLEEPKTAKSHMKSFNTLSSIQKDHESRPDTSKKFTIQNTSLKRTESLVDTSKDTKSLADSHDLVSVSSLFTDKESKDKKMQSSSLSNGDSRQKEMDTSRRASQERTLLSLQNQNSELLCEDSDHVHKPKTCKVTKLHPTKISSPDASENAVLKEDNGKGKSYLLSPVLEESSACGNPDSHTFLPSSTSSSSTSSSQLPVRRSSRLRNQSSGASPVTKDSRKTDSSSAYSESEQEIEGEDNNTPVTPKNLRRRSVRWSTTPRKARLSTE